MKFQIDNIDFYGPLDLLLELIKKKKCEIKNIFITDIIKQYFDILSKLESDNSELISNFIIMSSTLVEIKSRYLIYLDEKLDSEDDPGKELYLLLEEYKKIKILSSYLRDIYNKTDLIYTNKGVEIIIKDIVDFSKYTAYDLRDNYINLKRYNLENSKNKIVISFKKVSIEEKIAEIENLLIENDSIYFDNIIENSNRENIVASFLGMLELSKEQRVTLKQSDVFDKILIRRNDYEI